MHAKEVLFLAKGKKSGLAIGLVVVSGLALALGAYQYFSPHQTYLAVASTVAAGKPITRNDLAVYATSEAIPGGISASQANQVIGLDATTKLDGGTALTLSEVAPNVTLKPALPVLKKGLVGITVKADSITGVSDHMTLGSYVFVMADIPSGVNAATPYAYFVASHPYEVVGLQDTTASNGNAATLSALSLAVPKGEASSLLFASHFGALHFVLAQAASQTVSTKVNKGV